MTVNLHFRGGTVVLADQLVVDGEVQVVDERVHEVGRSLAPLPRSELIQLQGDYLAPGYVDLHVHGGAGADFMDGTEEAFRTVCRAHARHGTTSLLPTTTVARHEQ